MSKKTSPPLIGITAPTHLDLGRDVALGVNRYCQETGNLANVVINESDLRSEKMIPLLKEIIGHVVFTNKRDIQKWLPSVVSKIVNVSNGTTDWEVPQVINDDIKVGDIAFAELNRRRLHKLVFYAHENRHFTYEREEGFAAAAGKAGIPYERIERTDWDRLREVLTSASQTQPIGIFTTGDIASIRLLKEYPEIIPRIPNAISLIGVNNDSFILGMAPIPLSSVRLNFRQVGYEAAKWIHQNAGNTMIPRQILRIPPVGVETRFSTDILAIQDEAVRRALNLMRSKIEELRDVNDLVRKLPYGRRVLENRFREHLNQTLAQTFNLQKINKARQLLEKTNLSIGEISDICGFHEYRALSILFKRLTGESPRSYRQRCRIGER